MSPVVPRKRRPGQNTGRPAKVALAVEDQPCPRGGLHELRWVRGVVRCRCGATWAELDGLLNRREGSWLE